MKKIPMRAVLLLWPLIWGQSLLAQDKSPTPRPTPPSITTKDVEKHTYYFDLTGGKLTGAGADFLATELGRSQYVLIGEYHFSLQISLLTRALIPVLHETGFRNFGLEIGPISAEILGEVSKDPNRTIENLRVFNSQFSHDVGTRILTPIPFFGNVEDAEFLIEARKRRWNLIGLDQENNRAYLPLIERLYGNLSPGKKKKLRAQHEEVVKLINGFYQDDKKEVKKVFVAISESPEIARYLEAVAKNHPENQRITDAIRKTNEIYGYYRPGKYYDNNYTRAEYMKTNLFQAFEKLGFDVSRDKMVLKMGGLHTIRGRTVLYVHDIGNTLSELAAFHGKRSLHICFGRRYRRVEGKEVDDLETALLRNPNYAFQPLIQMGKKDKWAIIDLRQLRPEVFTGGFNFGDILERTIMGHDLYVIPPTDSEATPNYVLKK